jgi:tetratricopeptide (TPR) repeat protein
MNPRPSESTSLCQGTRIRSGLAANRVCRPCPPMRPQVRNAPFARTGKTCRAKSPPLSPAESGSFGGALAHHWRTGSLSAQRPMPTGEVPAYTLLAMFRTLDRIMREVWEHHYRIPEFAYWLVGLGSLILLPAIALALPESLLVLPVFGFFLSLVGVVRWKLAKKRCRVAMVVPLFKEGGGADGRASEAQSLIIDHLRRHLPEPLRKLIQPLPVEIGPDEDEFAARLRKRLRAMYVLHGRVAAQGDSWSVYPRVLEGPTESVTHYDRFTRDITPARPSFGPFVARLPATVGVRDEEFPLDFCNDLEAIIQGLLGIAFMAFGDHSRAVSALDEALVTAGGSTNHQIDALRSARAVALSRSNRADEGIASLRDRLGLGDPSPHLLRTLAYLLTGRGWATAGPNSEAGLEEARRHLRTALAIKNDPERDTTAYNLCKLLSMEDPETLELVDSLFLPTSSYQKLWYVRELRAELAWLAYTKALEAGDEETAKEHGRLAAQWYSRMLRARPRLQFAGLRRHWRFLVVKTFPRSPILYANTRDGHAAAGHRVRTRYFEWRFQRIRNGMLKRGNGYIEDGDWERAYWHFDWASCVGRRDNIEYRAATFAACLCWKAGHEKDGLAKWEELVIENPNALIARALLVMQLRDLGLDASVPGDGPLELERVVPEVLERFPEWGWDESGEPIPPLEDRGEGLSVR